VRRQSSPKSACLQPEVPPDAIADPWVGPAWVARAIGVVPGTVRGWVKLGLVPPPYRFGLKTLRWRKSTIETWIVSRRQAATHVG
jgi:predicted DNA-binding transcriptional regulator AlpA